MADPDRAFVIWISSDFAIPPQLAHSAMSVLFNCRSFRYGNEGACFGSNRLALTVTEDAF